MLTRFKALFFSLILSSSALCASEPLVIILLGPPGVGKSTQAKHIQEIRALPHISTGDLLRAHHKLGSKLGLKAQKYMEAGLLVPNQLVLDMLKDRIAQSDCSDGFILDGYPRSLEQVASLDPVIEGMELLVIDLQVSDTEVQKRILGRAASLPPEQRRADDTPEVLKQRLKIFHEQNGPVSGFYKKKGVLKEVDASLATEKVFAQILPQIRKG